MAIYIVIIALSITLVIYIMKHGKEMTNILLLAFALRLFLMIADLEHWFPILNSGADTEAFHHIAAMNQFVENDRTLTNYTVFLTFIYSLAGVSRLLAQFINVLFGMGVLLILVYIFRLLDVPEKRNKIALCLVAFMPNLVIFSSILLREAWVEFFVTLSVLQFIIWYRKGRQLNMLMCILSVLAASYMHSGVIGLLGGYITGFLAYNPGEGTVQFTPKTIVSIILMGGFFFLFSGNSEMFLGKFQSFDPNSSDNFLQYVNKTGIGNSGYLTWLPSTNNPIIGLLVAPLRMFYFLFAPLPTEWYRISDVIGFVIDGSVYMWMCWYIMKEHTSEENVFLKKCLVVSLLAASLIFGYGTSNAGTAFRHRAKLLSLIVVTYSISNIFRSNNGDKKDEEYEYKNFEHIDA